MSEVIFGQMGTEQENAEYRAWREQQRQENLRRIATGKYGDVPDELTAEDERILDNAWRELAEEEAEAEPIAA